MSFEFNNIKKKVTEDFDFNEVSARKVGDTFDDNKFVDTFYERLRLECYSYFKKIFRGIYDYNIDLTKADDHVDIALHQNLLVLDTTESEIKYPISHIIGSLLISKNCTNLTNFSKNFPRLVTSRLSVKNHMVNFKNCPDCHSLIIDDPYLTEFDFNDIMKMEHLHFLWFYINEPDNVKNFKNVQKFLDQHGYVSLLVTTSEDLNLLALWNLDGKYYSQFTQKIENSDKYVMGIQHINSEAYSDADKMNELRENIEFDRLQDVSVNDNVLTSIYQTKVKNELEETITKLYTRYLNKNFKVELVNSKQPGFTFDIKYTFIKPSGNTTDDIGSVIVNTSGIVERLTLTSHLIHMTNPNNNRVEPELSLLLYTLLESDLYFNEICIHNSGLRFMFDSMISFMPEDIKCNFPFELLKERVKKIIFDYTLDIYQDPHGGPARIDSRSSATLTFGYGELHFRKDKEEHMREIGHIDEFNEFWDVVTSVFDVDPNYGIHFTPDAPGKLEESVDFDSIDSDIDHSTMIYNASSMTDLLKKFKSVNESYLKNTQKKLHINGFNVIDQFNDLWFSVLFDDEIYKIKSISFYKHECISYGPYLAYNIFNTLCFINELDKYQIETIEFCERKEYHPYVLKNNFFDIVDNNVDHIIDLITKFGRIEKDKQNPDIWYKQCQKLYPISECFKNIKNIIFNANGAKLLMIDDSVAFKNENDYNNFVQKLLGGLTIENYSYYGDKLAEKPKFVTESVDFDKVNDGKVNYDVVFHNLSMMNDILKKFEYYNNTLITSNDLELHTDGFNILDQNNEKVVEIQFDDKFNKIKKITFFKYYSEIEYEIYGSTMNIFDHLCFLADLKKYKIEIVKFYQNIDTGVVPYIIHNDLFDAGLSDMSDYLTNLQMKPETWAKHNELIKKSQKIYPVSDSLDHIKVFLFYDYTADLIVDGTIAFANKSDYGKFESKLSLNMPITTREYSIVSDYESRIKYE